MEGVEFRFARDLQVLLGYTEWRNFLLVLNKAKESCKNSVANIEYHFVDINKKVKIGSGAEREIDKLVYELYGLTDEELGMIEGK